MCTKAVGDAFLMVAGGAQLAEGPTSSQEPFCQILWFLLYFTNHTLQEEKGSWELLHLEILLLNKHHFYEN